MKTTIAFKRSVAPKGATHIIPIGDLLTDISARAGLDPAAVDDYSLRRICDGTEWPPLEVVPCGKKFRLVDGQHRYAAALKLKLTTIKVVVVGATFKDGIRHLVSANRHHGVRMTPADRAHVLELAITHLRGESCAKIAELVGGCAETIRLHRKEIPGATPVEVLGRDGKTYPANLAKCRPSEALAAANKSSVLDKPPTGPMPASPDEGFVLLPNVVIDEDELPGLQARATKVWAQVMQVIKVDTATLKALEGKTDIESSVRAIAHRLSLFEAIVNDGLAQPKEKSA